MLNYLHVSIFVIKLISESIEESTEGYLHSIEGKWKANVSVKHFKPENRLLSMQRCFMTCPIDVMCFSNGFTDIPGQAIESMPESTHKTELPKTTPHKATTPSQAFSSNEINKKTTEIPGKRQTKKPKRKLVLDSNGKISFNSPALNTIWRRKLFLELKKSNNHARHTYKFRQFSPIGCYVICHHLQGFPSPSQSGFLPSQPPDGEIETTETTTEESDENDDDSYVEGEDQPIEITASPPDSQNKKNRIKIT